MNISKITPYNFKGETTQQIQPKEKHLTDNFQTKLKNSADMSDCITVPRTIFKGYLGIMVGTSLNAVASFMKPSIAKKALSITGIATSLYGTWAFVRPYILKDSVPTATTVPSEHNPTVWLRPAETATIFFQLLTRQESS